MWLFIRVIDYSGVVINCVTALSMYVAIRSGRFVSPVWFVTEVAFVVKHDSVELCKDLSVVFHFESPP